MWVDVLYGSRARGDADASSDRDILELRDTAHREIGVYAWEDLERMATEGSLFVQHLRRESKVLNGDRPGRQRWHDILRSTSSNYAWTERDLSSFRQVALDVKEALQRGDSPVWYEASVTARLVRHAAILACHLSGSANFTRFECVRQAAEAYSIPVPANPFESLYQQISRPNIDPISVDDVNSWVDFGQRLVDAMSRGEPEVGTP